MQVLHSAHIQVQQPTERQIHGGDFIEIDLFIDAEQLIEVVNAEGLDRVEVQEVVGTGRPDGGVDLVTTVAYDYGGPAPVVQQESLQVARPELDPLIVLRSTTTISGLPEQGPAEDQTQDQPAQDQPAEEAPAEDAPAEEESPVTDPDTSGDDQDGTDEDTRDTDEEGRGPDPDPDPDPGGDGNG